MKSAVVCYDSWHGHCADIADRIVTQLEARGYSAQTFSVRSDDALHVLSMDAAVVVAPIHRGHHSKSLREFISRYRLALDLVPTLFLPVSLSAEGTPSQRNGALSVMEDFLRKTRWVPARTKIVTGKLAYRRYTTPTRWLMRWMAWRAGGETNVGQNHVYTDWQLLNQQIGEFVDSIESAGSDASVQNDSTMTCMPVTTRVAS